MIVHDPSRNVDLTVPGNYDWELLLSPKVCEFMRNVSDKSVIEASGYTVIPAKKSRVGYWYTKEDLQDIREIHAVRLTQLFCNQTYFPIKPGEALAYPIPLYAGGQHVRNLFILMSDSRIVAEFQEVYDTSSVEQLSEILKTPLTQSDDDSASIDTLYWIMDARNGDLAFPDTVKTYSGDLLEKVLKNSHKKNHLFTTAEIAEQAAQKRKSFVFWGVALAVMLATVMATNVYKTREREKMAALLKKEQGLQTELELLNREERIYDVLAYAMKNQPNYSEVLSRIYSGSNILIHRTIEVKLLTVGTHVTVDYVLHGTSFIRMADVRPVLKKELESYGVVVDGEPAIIPNSKVVPEVIVNGHFNLVKQSS